MLLPRFLTALLGAPLLLAAVWWGQFPYIILIFGVILLSLSEYLSLVGESDWPVHKISGLISGAFLACSFFLFGTRMALDKIPQTEAVFSPAAVFLILVFLMVSAFLDKDKEKAFVGVAVTWTGVCYIVWSLSHLFLIRDLRPNGSFYTFFLFFVIWALDIGSYLGGRKFGRLHLAETISPKKTWEGLFSGAFLALATAFACRQIFLRFLSGGQTFFLALLIIVLALVSDLSESLFKRGVRVKDSGSLLPGHGGMLDRFDSFLLSAPLYYYSIVFFIKQ